MCNSTKFPHQNQEISVSNEIFLQAIFGVDWKTAHVTSFTEDPNNIPQHRRGICWGGHYIGGRILRPGNQYYTVSLFDIFNGKAVRQKAYFAAFHVLVIDDVGEKVSVDRLESLPRPNYILNTSADSQQWGWILSKPCRDFQKATNLLDGFVKLGITPDFKDPGMKGVTRYVRLPEGHNSKANRFVDGKPYKCKLVHWDPDGERHTIEQLADAFGIDLDVKGKSVFTSDNADVNHPILDKVEVKQKKAPGKFLIVCPWVEGHTNQDDSGTILYTGNKEQLNIGFECHHGSCDGQTGKHLLEWVEDNDPGWNARLKIWKTHIWLDEEINFNDIVIPDPIEDEPTKEPPQMKEVLDKLLRELAELPNDETAETHAFMALRIAEEVERVDQIRAHAKVKEHFGWHNENFKVILIEQRAKWSAEKVVKTGGHPQTLILDGFPHRKVLKNSTRLLDTMENTEHLLREYDITVEWNQIKKDSAISIPGNKSTGFASNLERIISLVRLNELPQINTVNRIAAIAHDNPFNPVVEHLQDLDYRGDGYIQELANHITVETDTEHIRDKIFKLWMILACAAADHAESTPNKEAMPKFDSVMIFVGVQGLEKTKFFRAMLPQTLRQYFKDGVMIDPTDKDSVSGCIKWWVAEAGEIDGMFRKVDIRNFKAFLSNTTDEFRKPYERAEREFERRTAFVASTNERAFLKDHTGNRRYWPLAVEEITIPIDENIINNAWAEAWQYYSNGEQWWPDVEFKKTLSSQTMSFQMALSNDPIEESIRDLIEKKTGKFMKDVVKIIDIRNMLLHRGMNEYNLEKTPSMKMISMVMNQYDLGFKIKTRNSRFWAIRNRDKYKKMKSADIEKYYNEH